MITEETLHSNSDLCARILDQVAFIKYQVVPVVRNENVGIVTANVVRGNDDIRLA